MCIQFLGGLPCTSIQKVYEYTHTLHTLGYVPYISIISTLPWYAHIVNAEDPPHDDRPAKRVRNEVIG